MDAKEFDHFYFARAMVLLVDDENGMPVGRQIKTMGDVIRLFDDIRDGKFKEKSDGLTLSNQLWFHLARYSDFIRSVKSD